MTPMESIAVYFQGYVRGPLNADMTAAISAWALRESGSVITGNNPWNLHYGPPCSVTSNANVGGLYPSQILTGPNGLIGNRYAGPGDQNVAIFSSLSGGVKAAVDNLVQHGSDWAGYDKILAAARIGSGVDFLNAIAASAWSAGRYGTLNGGPNQLLPTYYKLLAIGEDMNPVTNAPVAVADITSGGTVYDSEAATTVLITNWIGAKDVGIYAKGVKYSAIRIDMGTNDSNLKIAWVGNNKVTNVRIAGSILDTKHHVSLVVDGIEVFKEDV